MQHACNKVVISRYSLVGSHRAVQCSSELNKLCVHVCRPSPSNWIIVASHLKYDMHTHTHTPHTHTHTPHTSTHPTPSLQPTPARKTYKILCEQSTLWLLTRLRSLWHTPRLRQDCLLSQGMEWMASPPATPRRRTRAGSSGSDVGSASGVSRSTTAATALGASECQVCSST